MAEESRMNLAALQQRDPYITEIIDKAMKVTLYKFSQQRAKWSLTDIEGSLFVYKRSARPAYGLMILNRKDLNNLVQPLTSQVEFHLNTPFLLYKKLSDDIEDAILGIWFVDRGECLRLTETIQRILREVSGRAEDKRQETEPGVVRGLGSSVHDGKHGGAGPGQNILSLLSNAQKTYDQEHGASHDHSDLRPIRHASGDASAMPQFSVEDLFRTVNKHQAKAGLVDTGTDTTKNPAFARSLSVTEVESQPVEPNSQPDNRHPLLKLISSKTVAEIERQHIEEHKRLQGGTTTQPDLSPAPGRSGHSPAAGPTDGGSIDLMQLLSQGGFKQPIKHPCSEGDSGDKGETIAGDGAAAVKRLISFQDPRFGTNRGFVPVSLPSNAHSVNEIEHNLRAMSFGTATENSKTDDINGEKKESPNATLPASLGGFLKPSDLDPSLVKPKTPSSVLNSALSTFLPPQAFSDRPLQEGNLLVTTLPPEVPTATALASSAGLTPLNKEQLQQAMLHLIKSDSNFLNTLHAAYLESFHSATSDRL
ncbi:hypothetical protein BsWGS_13614 [Bradybaena similaris]